MGCPLASQGIRTNVYRMENLSVMESWNWGRPKSFSSGFTPNLGIVLSPALPDPHQASAGHVCQPPPPPLEAVHCITRKPGWKVLPDLSPIFPLFLVLLSGVTHNEAAFSVTGLTTLEKSAARLKGPQCHPVSLCPHPTMGLS